MAAESNVKVSVHMPAYNHAPYIAEALDSVLAQKTDFAFEIVIGEDCSTDDTRAVALEYARRHPEIIRLLLHEKNLGIFDNDQAILRACRGQYIAWLESDDYWTAPDKLRAQVDFLDRHPDHSAVFHWAGHVGEAPPTWRRGPSEVKPYYTVDDLLLHGHFVPSCTAVFRSELTRPAAEWTRQTPFLETTYLARFALSGKIGFLDREMAVFRSHRQGIYGKSSDVQNVQAAIHAHRLLGKHFQLSGRPAYRRGLAGMYRELSRFHRRDGRPFRAMAAGCRALWLGAGP